MSDSEQKAKKFLIDLIGNNKYNELQKKGKIEINSGEFVYELYSNGNVVNKTVNQRYCIIPSTNSITYPPSDILAIKWAWLNYGNKTVENVVKANNRTNLTGLRTESLREIRRSELSTYNDFVHYMESNNFYSEQLRINECVTTLISTYSLDAGCTGTVAEVLCPTGRQMTSKGITQIGAGEDRRYAYILALEIKDVNGKEIDKMVNVRIEKVAPSDYVVPLWRGVYGMLSLTRECEEINGHIMKNDDELFRWNSGFVLYGYDILRINLINSPSRINAKDVKIIMDCDMWLMRG